MLILSLSQISDYHHLNTRIQSTCNLTWFNIWEIATVFFWSPLQCEKDLEQIIARTPFVMHLGTFAVEDILTNDAISLDFCAQKFPLNFTY